MLEEAGPMQSLAERGYTKGSENGESSKVFKLSVNQKRDIKICLYQMTDIKPGVSIAKNERQAQNRRQELQQQ